MNVRASTTVGRLAAGVLAAGLVACGPDITVPPLAPGDVARLDAVANFPDAGYRIETGDTLDIRYPFHAEMDQQELVRLDGRITAVGVGDLDVAGSTTEELEARLAALTRDRLRDPEVHVTLVGIPQRSVYVLGEVRRPGGIEYRPDLSPLQAVVAAGGFLETANVESVILVRPVGTDGDVLSHRLDLDGELRDEQAGPTVRLAPRDVLVVPRTSIANADVWVDQHITQLLPFVRGTSLRMPGAAF